MGGHDTIKGIGYQNAYTMYRLLALLDRDGQAQMVTVEGRGEDIEDLTIAYDDGSEEAIQVKKRETREGPYGLWGLNDVKPIVAALHHVSESGRNVTALRFVATGSAHPRVIAIQKACERVRDGTFAPDRDGRAVSDVSAMVSASEKQTRRFMRHLWLDVPMESEAHFEQAVQNCLMRDCGVPPDAVVRVYNDLYKRLLDKGKKAKPDARAVTREELLDWLEEPRDPTLLEKDILVEVRQRVQELRGGLVGAEIEEMGSGTLMTEQEVGRVEKDGTMTGVKIGRLDER